MMLELNRIYQGDCLELMKKLPDNSMDMVLTDPPYGINYLSTRTNNYDRLINDNFGAWIE